MVQSADSARQPAFPYWSSVYEWPSTILTFVAEARRILSYLKNYGEDQRPPKSIWHSGKKCDKWIKAHDPFKKDGAERGSGIMFEDYERE